MLQLIILLFAFAFCDGKPNFVVILTDDQDVALGGMEPMKNVKRFIANEGVSFVNSYVTSPICCPSRASFLTGLYVHNHLTQTNQVHGGCNGAAWRQHETKTFAAALHNAGYNTFYAGKYLNEYGTHANCGPERVPPGWSEWHGLVGNSRYYNYTLSNNGVPTYSEDLYLTDVIRDLGVSFIENQTDSEAFLMVLAPPAPHQPFTPAPRHMDSFKNVTVFKPPNFNYGSEDKHWLLSMKPSPLPETMMPELDRVYRTRWESLLAVDEMAADVFEALDSKSLLNNTYIIYTSDNGYHIGQFSQVYDKRQPYESDVRVPLLIKGPGIQKNTESLQPIINIDIAPTILELARVPQLKKMDGRPIDLFGKGNSNRPILFEYFGEGRDDSVDAACPWKYDGNNLAECYPEYNCKCQDSRNNTYACLRLFDEKLNVKYCVFTDTEQFQELYDLNEDPFELENIVGSTLPFVKYTYKEMLSKLLICKGAHECNSVDS